MEYIPVRHAAAVGRQYPGLVWFVTEFSAGLELDLTRFAPGRDPSLPATLWFNQTVFEDRARLLAPGDPVEVVLIEINLDPHVERYAASLPADPAWLTWNNETVRRLARHIRETGETHLLPILADALEDAGCTDAALLERCREPHEVGERSWVVELLANQQ